MCLAERGVVEEVAEMGGEGLVVGGVGIEGGVATSFGHGGDVGGDDGAITAEGFENRDTEPFEDRHVDTGESAGIEGGEVAEVGFFKEDDTLFDSAFGGYATDLLGVIASGAADDYEMHFGGQEGESTDSGSLILAFLDGADRDNIPLRKVVFISNF